MQDPFPVSSKAPTCLPRYAERPGVRARKTALRMALTLAATFLLSPAFANSVTNPVSAFPITVDGQFTGGVSNGTILGEWSDVTPLAFIAPFFPNGSPTPTFRGDPNANTLVYAVNAPEPNNGPVEDFYLMYDFLPRVNPNFTPGETIASIVFPINVPASLGGGRRNIDVQFRGLSNSFFDVFVDVNLDNVNDAAALGIEGSVGFGPSTLSPNPHLLAELSIPLDIPPGFGDPNGPFPPSGQPGAYSPDPAFWGAGFGGSGKFPEELTPASATIVRVNPDGSVTISQTPEPSTISLFGSSTLVLLVCACRRKRRTR